LTKLCAAAKNRAKVKNLPFNITSKYIWQLWEESGGRCALTKQKFDLTKWGGKGQVNPQAPSIDRIDPKLGYVKGNVRLITYHMNVALTDFGVDEFRNLLNCFLENN
jgi:hypothetical protein